MVRSRQPQAIKECRIPNRLDGVGYDDLLQRCALIECTLSDLLQSVVENHSYQLLAPTECAIFNRPDGRMDFEMSHILWNITPFHSIIINEVPWHHHGLVPAIGNGRGGIIRNLHGLFASMKAILACGLGGGFRRGDGLNDGEWMDS